MLIPVILAGGSGSRLWPLSRAKHPKQFHALVSAEPLLVDAARRAPSVKPFAPPFIITNEENRFGVAAAFKNAKLAHQGIVLEPVGRSTAPAAAVAAQLAIERTGPEAVLLIMPSDHHIDNPRAFLNAVEGAPTLDFLLLRKPDNIDDPYTLALVGNALLALDATGERAAPYLDRLETLKKSDGRFAWWQRGAD